MKENITKYMRKSIIIGLLLAVAMPLAAQQDAFDKFKQQQNAKFDKFKTDQQAEFDAFRKRIAGVSRERLQTRHFPVRQGTVIPPKK